MKTFKTFAFAAFAAIIAISCSKEIAPVESVETPVITPTAVVEIDAPTPMTFTGVVDNEAETKTVLSGASINWAAKETIYLFDGTAPRAFTSTNDAEASTVTFTGSASSADAYYAIYPSGTISSKVITTSIPVIQAATTNSFAPKANVAVAYTTSDPTGDNVLKFKNVGAVVKFQVSNDDVRKVMLEALNGEKMSGEMQVTFGDGASFTSTMVDAKAESCVVLDGGAGNLSALTPYYLAINPTTYSGGFKITLLKADGSFASFSNITSNTLARNDLMDMGTIPVVSSWKTGGAIDELTRATTGISNGTTTYSDWSGKTTTSSAVYAGNSAGGNNAIQLRSTSNSGIVSTTSGGKVTKVSVSWNSNTASGRTLDVYGKNTAYSSASDLYSSSTRGTKIGSIVYGTSTELVIDDDYEYIGIRSSSNALYLDELDITWGDPSVTAPTLPIVDDPSTAITNVSGTTVPLAGGSVTFDVDSNVPWTVSTNQPSYSSVSVSGNTVTVTFGTLDSGERNAIVIITPIEGTPVSETFTQTGAQIYSLYSGVLTEGDYIIVYDNGALTNSISSDRFGYTSVTPSAGKITNPDASIVWHISPSGDYWTIYNASVEKYAASTGAKNKGQLLDSGTDDKSLWSVSSTAESETYDFVNKQNTTNSVNATLRKNTTYGFACYSTDTGGALTLYRK